MAAMADDTMGAGGGVAAIRRDGDSIFEPAAKSRLASAAWSAEPRDTLDYPDLLPQAVDTVLVP